MNIIWIEAQKTIPRKHLKDLLDGVIYTDDIYGKSDVETRKPQKLELLPIRQSYTWNIFSFCFLYDVLSFVQIEILLDLF